MKAVTFSAVVPALLCFCFAAEAQEAGRASIEQEPNPRGTEPPLWSETAAGESSLLTQFNAVIASLRGNDEERERAVIDVNVEPSAGETMASRNANCRFMPSPGSRIRAQRCFHETEVEQALNDYQFDEELRYAREQAVRQKMQETSEALRAAAIMRMVQPSGGRQ